MSIRQDITIDMGRFSGDDLVIDWYLTTGPAIVVDGALDIDATVLRVQPLKRALADGTLIRFAEAGEEGLVVELAEAAVVGATELSVAPAEGYLRQGQRGFAIQDASAFAFSIYVTLPPAAGVLLSKTVSVEDGPAGHLRAVLTDADTETTLTGKSYHYRTRRTDDGLEQTVAYGTLALRRN